MIGGPLFVLWQGVPMFNFIFKRVMVAVPTLLILIVLSFL